MKSLIRTFVLLPALVLALVAIPAVVMAAGGAHTSVVDLMTSTDLSPQHGCPQPCGTVPPPTPHPHPIPPKPYPPHPVPPPPAPTATPTTRVPSSATVGTSKIIKVIGDRLSSTMYAYTSNGWLYRSDRDGRAWSLVTPYPTVTDFIMSAADPNVLYSGAALNCKNATATISPMYKSEDGGYSWVELPTGSNMQPMLASQSDANSVFAADCSTIYLSTDGGATWTPKPELAADNLWQTYAPVDMASGSLVGNPRPATPHWEQIFAAGNNVQGAGVVAFTGDQGASWADITNPAKAPSGIKAINASLFEGGKLWVVDNKGVWMTNDYGVTWIFSNKGLSSLYRTFSSPLNDITYDAEGNLYLATQAGLYKLSPEGDTWIALEKDGDGNRYPFTSQNLKSLVITETNPQRIWINALVKDGDDTVERVFTYMVGSED